ncbi:RNA-binding domain-containing protein, partial [Rhizoclosmatium globosum]
TAATKPTQPCGLSTTPHRLLRAEARAQQAVKLVRFFVFLATTHSFGACCLLVKVLNTSIYSIYNHTSPSPLSVWYRYWLLRYVCFRSIKKGAASSSAPSSGNEQGGRNYNSGSYGGNESQSSGGGGYGSYGGGNRGNYGSSAQGSSTNNVPLGVRGGASSSSASSSGVPEGKQEDTIYITGLPDTVTEDSLAQHFGQIGIIKTDKKLRPPGPKIWIYRDKASQIPKGDATLSYEDPPAAQAAIKFFSGKSFPGGGVITVVLADAPAGAIKFAESGGRGGGRGGRGGGRGGFGDRGGYGGGGGGRGGPPGGGRVTGNALAVPTRTLPEDLSVIAVKLPVLLDRWR